MFRCHDFCTNEGVYKIYNCCVSPVIPNGLLLSCRGEHIAGMMKQIKDTKNHFSFWPSTVNGQWMIIYIAFNETKEPNSISLASFKVLYLT